MPVQELTFRINVSSSQAQAEMKRITSVVNAEIKKINQNSAQEVSKLRSTFATEFQNIANKVPVVGNALSGVTAKAGEVTSSLGALGTAAEGAGLGMTAMVGAVGAGVIALGALSAGAVIAAKEIFELTKETAAFQGKFEDLSQQVGVSVETLSTLDIVASTTGGSIETVTASLGIFQKNLEAAHDPTSKEAKILKDLGVTSLNTEVALRQTIKGLSTLTDTGKQTTDALTLFGRSGRFVNAIMKESSGNLDEATEKFHKLGLGISTEAALAADQFNDSMEIMSRQLDAIRNQIFSQSIPVFIALFEEISQGLSGSKDGWKSWSNVVETSVAGAIALIKTLAGEIASLGTINPADLFNANFFGLLDRAAKIRSDLLIKSQIQSIQNIQSLVTSGRPGDRPDASKAKSQAQAQAGKEAALAQQAEEESFRFHREALERERTLDLKNIEEWAKESVSLLGTHLAAQQRVFDQERDNAQRFITNRKDRDLALREIEQKDTKAQNDYVLGVARIKDEAQKKQEQSEVRFNSQLLAIREAERQGELERIQDARDRQAITESVALSKQLEIIKQAFDDRILLLNLELEKQSTSAERKTEIDNEKIASEIRFTDTVKRLSQERIDALAREAAAKEPQFQEVSDQERARRAGEAANQALPPPPAAERHFQGLQKELDALGESFAKLIGLSGEFAKQVGRDLSDLANGAIEDIARGIGTIVENYVLLGETGPAALRKLLAATLAHLAAEAAVKAVFQLAEGFASLFINPAEAAGHFKAAALFGSIAGVAAVAGRGVAGDLFQQKTNNSGANQSTNNGQLNPLTFNRNQPQVVTVIVKPDGSKFGDAITAHILDDHSQAGPIRETFANDGRF